MNKREIPRLPEDLGARQMGDIVSKKPNVQVENKKEQDRTFKDGFFNKNRKEKRIKLPNLISKTRKESLKKGIFLLNIKDWILMATVFLLPLWFLPWGTDKIGLPKQLLMTVLLGIGFVIWLYENMIKGKIIYRKSIINIAIWILLLVATISTVFSLNPVTSIYASQGNFLNLWNIVLLGIFYLMVISSRKQKESKKWYKKISLIDIFVTSVGILVVYTLFQIFGLNILGGFTKIIGFNPMGSINSVALIAGLALLIELTRFTLKNETTEAKFLGSKVTLTAINVLIFIFLILVNFRVVWYGLILGSVFLIFLKLRKGMDLEIRSFVFPLIVLIVSIVFSSWGFLAIRLGMWQPEINLKNLPSEELPNLGTSLQVAQKSLSGENSIKEKLFGVGLGNYDKMWLKYHSAYWNQTRFIQGSSSFTTLLTETGCVGLLSFLTLIFASIWQGIKKIKTKSQNIEENIAFVGIIYLSLVWFFYPFNLTLYFALFLMFGILAKQKNLKKIEFNQPIQKALILSLISVLTMVVIIFAGYFVIQRYVSSVDAAKGMTEPVIEVEGLEQEEIVAKAQEELNKKNNFLVKSYNLDKSNDEVLRKISQLYLTKINLAIQIQDQDVSSYVQSALVAAKKAIEVNTAEYLNYVNLAQIYENLIAFANDAYSFAIINYEEALKLNPNDSAIIFSMARSQFAEAVRLANIMESLEGQSQKNEAIETQNQLLAQAIENLNKTIELTANYTPAHQLLAQIYDAQGNIEEAITSTSNLIILNPSDAGLWYGLGILHYKNNDMTKAEISFNEAIKLNNDYSNARYFLGLVYSKQEKQDLAIAQFEKIAELNPDNEEIKQILKNLETGEGPLVGIVPPAETPENRGEVPVVSK